MKISKLSIRDLFWLVLVAALALGWWLSYSDLRRMYDQDLGANLQQTKRLYVESEFLRTDLQKAREQSGRYADLKKAIEAEGFQITRGDKLVRRDKS